MQGVGAENMSMGGAATAMPIGISGAIQWNPATLSAFKGKILDFNIGAFSSSPELSSSIPAGMMFSGSPAVSGTTYDDRGISPMPALAFVYGKEGSKSTFGISAFGISGFGVTFPQETNLPMDANGTPNPNWNPSDSNPISYPQSMGGFGNIQSDYMLLQVSLSWSYEIVKGLSIGIQPNFNYATLELEPNPLSSPSMTLGYPVSDKASAIGYGAQFGIYYAAEGGVKLGVSYKTTQSFDAFDFKNTYLDGSPAPDVSFTMDYPAILSFGVGYSTDVFDITADYRNINYSNTEGFEAKGWTQTGSVQGFGWQDVNVFSAGFQLKVVDKLPIRIGYTYGGNPIVSELTFFSIPATAVIKNAFQVGLGYEFNDKIKINGLYHYGKSDGETSGNLLNPMMVSASNPYGAIPGTSVGYKMDTSMLMFGITYDFAK
jgi:long-chain fatty acid transport protein